MSKVKFVQTQGYDSRYEVLLDGVSIGRVEKHADHYNLRRPTTVHYWRAQTPDGERLKPPWSVSGYRTRALAADALVEAAQ